MLCGNCGRTEIIIVYMIYEIVSRIREQVVHLSVLCRFYFVKEEVPRQVIYIEENCMGNFWFKAENSKVTQLATNF